MGSASTNTVGQKHGNGVAASEVSGTRRADPVEVGWLFVQEYYTHMNGNPGNLHAFYNNRSYFLHGRESDPTLTCRGQQEIQKRIAELDLKDCKVLVSDVDSQPSLNGGIIVQVIGQLSNKGGPAHKFVQTFWLAEQPDGYFVLNDILRYLKEDVDETFDSSSLQQTTQRAPDVGKYAEETATVKKSTASSPSKVAPAAAKKPTEPATSATPWSQPVASTSTTATAPAPTAAPSAPNSPPKSTASATPSAKDKEEPEKEMTSKAPANRTWANLAAKNSGTWQGDQKTSPNVSSGVPTASSEAPETKAMKQSALVVEKSKVNGVSRAESSATNSGASRKFAGDRLTSDGRRIPGPERDLFCIYVKPTKGPKDKLIKEELEQVFGQYGPNVYCVINEKYNAAVVEFETMDVPKQLIGQAITTSNGSELQILVRGGDNSRQQSAANRTDANSRQSRRSNRPDSRSTTSKAN